MKLLEKMQNNSPRRSDAESSNTGLAAQMPQRPERARSVTTAHYTRARHQSRRAKRPILGMSAAQGF
ncbi:hypothetical protein [Allofranklinella schreckenbergeri]|uniref:hypothetical protein n=1 Tax=Allofranklinella schreckenbergeri TaxID=1076744 RepID=UPI000F9C11B0|nr:hypothetical protein [Allofranklinella schreckenbergeri]RRD42402.1 hypothetical protein EII18_05865 [Comamonadaceae bacterium OH3737_COT-264]